MSRQQVFKTAALYEVNEHILGAARASIVQEQTWEFFCECGDEDCGEHVELSIDEYVALRENGRPVLAPGHRLSRATLARRRSQELSEELKAMRAPAEQEANRAKKRTDSGD